MTRALLLGLLLFSARETTRGEWELREILDPLSETEAEAVVVRNPEGFTLALFRAAEGRGAHGLFRFPPGKLDFLDSSSPLVLHIDDHKPQQTFRLGGGLKWSQFPVWDGEGRAILGTLRQLMEGNELVVAYPLHGGGYKETRFDLDGAKERIAILFEIPEEVSEEEKRAATRMRSAVDAEMERCLDLKKKRQKECLARLQSCREEGPESAEELRECLDAEE